MIHPSHDINICMTCRRFQRRGGHYTIDDFHAQIGLSKSLWCWCLCCYWIFIAIFFWTSPAHWPGLCDDSTRVSKLLLNIRIEFEWQPSHGSTPSVPVEQGPSLILLILTLRTRQEYNDVFWSVPITRCNLIHHYSNQTHTATPWDST